MRTLALALALLVAPATAGAGMRLAVVVGNNTGSAGRPKLWFAERDAERFARSLVELGDFSKDAVLLLRGASADALREVLASADVRLASAKGAGQGTLLVFFFSGHAASGGLELGADQFRFDELRGILQTSSADARVGIVDACESGVLTQVKGARAAPELDFPLPADGAKGIAYIASTAIGEAAQESAALGGSFFTFHLDAALRGAADADGDGQVTLAEAFRYTSGRTVIGTAGTDLGAQHPTYDIRMSGRGDVVLTNLRRADARLRLQGSDRATFLISDRTGLVAEAPGGAIVALPAGRYRVERRQGGARAEASVVLEKGETRAVESFAPMEAVALRSKGGEAKVWSVVAGFGAGSMPLTNMGLSPTFRVGLRRDVGALRLSAAFEYLQTRADDRGLRYRYASVGGTLQASAALFERFVRMDAGLRGGWAWNTQTLDSGARYGAGGTSLGFVLTAEAPVGPVRIGLEAEGGARWVHVNGALAPRLRLQAGAFVALLL
jgi:hypothetical protein